MTRTHSTFPPPVMEARRWLEGVTFPPERPLMNVSQAAPVDPPPTAMREAMAQATGLPAPLCRTLVRRGVAPEDADAFLAPTLRNLLPDPRSL